MRRKASRHAPAPSRPPAAARRARRRARGRARARARARRSTSWSVDSKPSTSTARSPSPAPVCAASSASISRQLAGRSPACTTARTASAPARNDGEAHRAPGPVRRARLHAHPRLGDDAEDPLRAQQQPVGRGPGARARQPPRRPRPARRDRAHGLDEVVDVRRARGEVPARARRDPAAEGRELEGLRVEAHGQPVRAELLLQARARGAGADARRARDRVDLEHAVQRAEVERHGAVEARRDPRLDAADDARAAAVGDHGDVRVRRPLERGLHLRLVGAGG